MKNIRAFLSVVLAVSGTCAFAAKDLYVSEDKSYGADLVPPEQLFDDLQAAVDASANNDTIWVKDGFVCKDGANAPYDYWDKSLTSNRISVISKINLLIRSESGYVDETNGKGATIRGSYNSDAEKCGVASIRPILLHDRAKLQGFILENGSANSVKSSLGGGGAWIYRSTLTNCVIRNCHAPTGGGVFLNNNSAGQGVFRCVISNNVATSSAGGIQGCNAVFNTLIAGNSAGTGGGATSCTLTRCSFLGNFASYRGGGVYNCNAYNGKFIGNRLESDNSSSGGGAIYSYYSDSDEYVNCLIQGQLADTQGAAAIQAFESAFRVVNCTIYANTNVQTAVFSGVGGCIFGAGKKRGSMCNVISYANVGRRNNDNFGAITNCCLASGYSATESVGCFSEDPRLTSDENGNLVPKNRRCRNSGTVFRWMTDPNDVRSKDLAGKDRILGSAPDFGCFESTNYGLLLMLR